MTTAPDFASRSQQSELMDTESVGFEEFRGCLVDLARVNRLSLAYRPTLAFFDRIAPLARRLGRPLRVVDAGSGYGDTLRQVRDWALAHQIEVELIGVDLNPWSARAAAEATHGVPEITWVTEDLFCYEPPGGIDVVMSSLFAHHLDDEQLVRFVQWMDERARVGWIVNDLHRHPVPYHFFRHFSRLVGLHRFVQHDGPVSIARAFTARDWERMLRRAGLGPASVSIEWWMPFRLVVSRIEA